MINKTDFANLVLKFTHEFYELNPARELMHTFIGLSEDGVIDAVQVSWFDTNSQIEVLKTLHEKYKELNICMYAYIGEGWGSYAAPKLGQMPSQCSDRFETSIVLIQSKEDGHVKKVGRTYRLKRDSKGHVCELEPLSNDLQATRISSLLNSDPNWYDNNGIRGDAASY